MKNSYKNGYQQTIEQGIAGVRRFKNGISRGSGNLNQQILHLQKELETAEAVVIGAGAGLSTAAGMTYSGKRFEEYFFDFEKAYGFQDMYTGGFYVMQLDPEVNWAFWARNIYINRYLDPPKPVYQKLLKLVKDKNYFVITTNVDHQFQRAGFDKKRLFYTQGDYGLFQSVDPSIQVTFDNEQWVMQAMEAQGFVKDKNGKFHVPKNKKIRMEIPSYLIPKCPLNGSDVTMNLRADDSFVENEGWHQASAAYLEFLKKHSDRHVLFMEIGVGNNTPVIIKYPFWQMTHENPKAVYACLNYHEAYCPKQIESRSICMNGDTADILDRLMGTVK